MLTKGPYERDPLTKAAPGHGLNAASGKVVESGGRWRAAYTTDRYNRKHTNQNRCKLTMLVAAGGSRWLLVAAGSWCC